jgi:hypothetical protein
MILPAISGTRLRSRKILNCTIAPSKKGSAERTATATVKSGTMASSVVKVSEPAICGQRSSRQRRRTNATNPAQSRRKARTGFKRQVS